MQSTASRPFRASLPGICAILMLVTWARPEGLTAQSRVGEMLRSRVEWSAVPWSDGTLNVALIRPDARTEAPHPVLLALPWGAGTADLVETFVASYWLTEPSARGYYVVAPEVRGSTLDRTADEVISALFEWMDADLEYDAERVALVGASNGGRGAFFAALAQPDRFQAIMTLPGHYSGPAADLDVLAEKPIYFLVGSEDQRWVELTEETREALASHGISSGLWVVPGQGHVMRLDPRPLLDWIDSALER